MSKKVLIVDDDSSIVSILTYALDDKGFETLPACTGEDARQLAFSEKPDAIVMDVLLPKLDGFTLLKEFRTSDELKETPIIIISGVYKTYSVIQKTLNDGANEYFEKPFSVEEIVKKILEFCPVPQSEKKKTEPAKSASKYLFAEDIPDSGELSVIPPQKIFAAMFTQKKSGLLTLSDKSVEKKVMLKDGAPIEVSSNIVGEWLGRLLVRENAITSEQYKNTLEMMGGDKKRHGEILLSERLLTPAELYKYLKMQLIEKIINTFSWSEGTYRFSPEEKLDRVSPKTVNVQRMVLDGILHKTDIAFINNELNEINANSVFSLRNKDEVLNCFSLSGTEQKCASLFDGSKKLSSVLEDSISQSDEFYKLLYTFLLFNSLRLVGAVSGQYEKLEKASKYTKRKAEPLTDDEQQAVDRISKLYDNLATLNYYELLDIPNDAEVSEIKKAYFRLAKDLHPDKFASNKFDDIRGRTSKVFSKIADAYQTLSDEEQRAKYDNRLKSGKSDEEDDQLKKANNILQAEMQFQKGQAFLNSKDYDKAHEAFEWSIKLNPKEAEYHLYEAVAIFKDTKKNTNEARAEAKKIIKRVISMNANLADAHYYLGMIHKVEKNEAAAKKSFLKSTRIDPKHVDANRELRLIAMRDEKKEKKGFLKGFFK
jgi:CheY-like chemotaxis protein/tetratricopeptide (TPR) repeat protein